MVPLNLDAGKECSQRRAIKPDLLVIEMLLSTGHELSVRMGFQISLGDGDYGSGISRYWDRHWSFHAGGRGAWAAAGL